MGITGLTKYVDTLDNLFIDYKLTNCDLLIDGYSLLHKFNYKLDINCQFGGNYNELYFYLNNFFNLLNQCKINTFFIFDGARDLNEKKSLKRAKQRILNSLHKNIENLLPINAYRILIDLLKQHKVKYYQCNFEADYEIAYLANNYFKCPILSNDSDYYIYNLDNGYIPIDTIDFEFNLDSSTNEYFLNSKLFKIEKFCSFFKIETPRILPIFAVLCGNDYVDQSVFKPFMLAFISENNNMKSKSSKFNNLKKQFNIYKRVLEWLSESPDTDDCIKRILRFIKKESHEEINLLINKSIENYFNFVNDSLDVDLNYIKSIFSDDNAEVKSTSKIEIDKDFMIKYNKFEYSRLALDLLLQQRVVYSCQIEIIDWPSTYLTSIDIRNIFYSLIFKYYYFNQKNNKDEEIIIKEYLRLNKDLRVYEVKIDNEINIDENNVLYKLFSCFKSSLIEDLMNSKEFNNKIKIFYLLLLFWLNTTNENVSQLMNKFKNLNSIRAFIVSFIRSTIIDQLYEEIDEKKLIDDDLKVYSNKDFKSFDEYFNYLHGVNLSEVKNHDYFKNLYRKLNEFQKMDAHKLNLKHVHCLCEFQAIYHSVSLVKEFLEDKLDLIKLEKFFSGSFLYNFTTELNNRKNPDLYIEELFSRRSVFTSLYKFLLNGFIKISSKIQKEENIEILKEKDEDDDGKAKYVDKNNKYSYLQGVCEE